MQEDQEQAHAPSSSSKRRGRPPEDEVRREKMLNEATPHMNRIALETLRHMFNLTDVARASDLNPKTVRGDWNDDAGTNPTDKFILRLACDQLYGVRAPWIDQVWIKIVQDWPQQTSPPEEKFVTAIAAIYREMLKRPETVGR